jgi:hypothetical protein
MFRELRNLNFVIVSACDEPLGLSSSTLRHVDELMLSRSLPKGSGRVALLDRLGA